MIIFMICHHKLNNIIKNSINKYHLLFSGGVLILAIFSQIKYICKQAGCYDQSGIPYACFTVKTVHYKMPHKYIKGVYDRSKILLKCPFSYFYALFLDRPLFFVLHH